MADRIWLIRDSRVIEGAPEDLVLSGDFSTLFNSSRVIFDPEDGSFRMPSAAGTRVNLKGEGKYRFWTMKALERAGYITDDSDRDYWSKLLLQPSLWKCSSDSGTRTFENIYELIRGWEENRSFTEILTVVFYERPTSSTRFFAMIFFPVGGCRAEAYFLHCWKIELVFCRFPR